MVVTETPLPGLLVLAPKVHGDGRGFFLESYHAKTFTRLGVPQLFVQDNHSRSGRGVTRGLHFQKKHGQGKLVRVVTGSVYDVAVDLRAGSPTFGRWFGAVLSDENKKMMYVPEGFAHGFQVMSEQADFFYKCTDFYDPEDEGGILWNDPDLAIDWPVSEVLVSGKDSELQPLSKTPPDALPRIRW
ncbi:MAG: dTDP-4-dehydrorhamnose 3,5-epimerase [Nitrospirota bacterium]|nr:dTDP-4-dehydrorhamnose 3,5-epimerase [Nitrospirota bacterium]